MSGIGTGARDDVLSFYKDLQFNVNEKPEIAADLIKKRDNVQLIYPQIEDFHAADSLLEIGCGAGWLSNSIAYYYGLDVTGIDFNPKAIGAAQKTAEELDIDVRFECADLFQYQCEPKDVVISIGVLHHTSDTGGGLKNVLT